MRILIVGGGIAGLALGRALRTQGFAPEIIEPGWHRPVSPRQRRSGAWSAWSCRQGAGSIGQHLPVGPNCLYCYADLEAVATEDPTGRTLSRFLALFGDFGEPARGILRELESFESIHFSPVEEIDADAWVHGRVVLIGDAAHATSPNMAEGASMALEDALVLTRMLATHGSPVQALSAFRERRRARVGWVRQRTHGRDRIRTLPAPLRDLARRLAGTALYRRDYRPLLDEP